MKLLYESRKRISRSLTTNKESEVVHEEVRKEIVRNYAFIHIRLAVEEGRTLQNIHFVIHYFARRRNFRNPCQLSLSQPKRRERKGYGER